LLCRHISRAFFRGRIIDAKIYINCGNIVRNGYFLGVDIKRNSLIVDVDKLREYLGNMFLKIRKPVVVDTHIIDVISPEYVLLVVVLRTAIEELYKRLKKKGFTTRKIMENIDAEICKICAQDARELYDLEKIIEIDTTYRAPEDTAVVITKEIKKRLKSTKGEFSF